MIFISFLGDIGRQKQETGDIERNINHMQNAMLKLNTLLHKEKGLEYDLEQGNVLRENDFLGSLRVIFTIIHLSYSERFMLQICRARHTLCIS